MMIAGGVIGGLRTEVIFVSAASNSSSPLNNFNQNDQSFGPGDPSRQVIVLAYGDNANLVSDQNFTTAVTIGGVSAVRKIAPTVNRGSHFTAWITPRLDSGGPSGTSGTIQIRRATGNGYSTVGFAAFAAYNLREGDPVDFYMTMGQAPAASGPVALVGGGILTALARAGTTGEFVWAGADEVYDERGGVNGSQRFSAALLNKTPGNPEHVVTADSAANSDAMLAVSWR